MTIATGLLAATGWEVTLGIIAALALAGLWLTALFLIVLDDISWGAKAVWLILCIPLAPIAVPLYLILRSRRHSDASASDALP